MPKLPHIPYESTPAEIAKALQAGERTWLRFAGDDSGAPDVRTGERAHLLGLVTGKHHGFAWRYFVSERGKAVLAELEADND